MPSVAVQPSQVVSNRKLPDAIDQEWLEAFRAAVAKHGAKKELALAIGVAASEITRLAQGQAAPPSLVLAVSRQLQILLPRSWFEPEQYEWLSELQRLKSADPNQVDDLTRRIRDSVERRLQEDSLWESKKNHN